MFEFFPGGRVTGRGFFSSGFGLAGDDCWLILASDFFVFRIGKWSGIVWFCF